MKTTIVFLMLCASTLGAQAQTQQLPSAPIEIVYRDSLKRLDYFDSLNIWAHDRAIHSLLFGSRVDAYLISREMRWAHDSILTYQAALAKMILDGKDSINHFDANDPFKSSIIECQECYRRMLGALRDQLANNIRTWNAFVRIYPPIFEHDVTAAEKSEGAALSDDN